MLAKGTEQMLTLLLLAAGAAAGAYAPGPMPDMVAVPAGSLLMGYSRTPLPLNLSRGLEHMEWGDWDESPYQRVDVPALEVSATEVTNLQFEQFDPSHRALRGRLGFSTGDAEAVVFVTWYDAVNYTRWLSGATRACYRLPTEAEWEHAARAGTTTYFSTGDTFPEAQWKNQTESWFPAPDRPGPRVVNLTVAEFPPNGFGLYDAHGNVEEWTADWYGRYGAAFTDELFRSTRGGSHSTYVYYLRSANRAGALPDDSSWVIGFRVVRDPSLSWQACAAAPLGAHRGRGRVSRLRDARHPLPPSGAPVPPLPSPSPGRARRAAHSAPVFLPPLEYVLPTHVRRLPLTKHNHSPGLAVCANGDVVATFFTTYEEPGRVCGIAIARLAANATRWSPPEVFFDAPDRTDSAPMMWQNEEQGGRLYHYHGLNAAGTYGSSAVVAHYSDDCGRSWSSPWWAMRGHGVRHAPINTVVRLDDGRVAMACDNNTVGEGGTAVQFSADNGTSWTNEPYEGHDVLGIHATGVTLRNGSLLYHGRGQPVGGRMPRSRSDDGGASWTVSAAPFWPIGGGQRHSMLRLAEGPIAYCSFTPLPGDTYAVDVPCGAAGSGSSFSGYGLFCAVSTDEGTTWPARRLVSDDGGGTVLSEEDQAPFVMNATHAERKGYTVLRQSPADGMLHLITSRQHYRFSYSWLVSRPPCPAA